MYFLVYFNNFISRQCCFTVTHKRFSLSLSYCCYSNCATWRRLSVKK